MNKILKKINDRAEYIAKKTGDEECDSNNELIAMGLQIAIEIIQSEQKESRTKGDVIRESNENLARYLIENAYRGINRGKQTGYSSPSSCHKMRRCKNTRHMGT